MQFIVFFNKNNDVLTSFASYDSTIHVNPHFIAKGTQNEITGETVSLFSKAHVFEDKLTKYLSV